MQIGGDDDIERLGFADHHGGDRINENPLGFHFRVLLCDLVKHLIPQHHAMALRIGFCDECEMPARPFHGQFKSKPVDAGRATTGEYGDFGGQLRGESAMHATARAGIFAL